MRTVTLQMYAAGVDADEAFHRVSDFPRYPAMTDTVRDVRVSAAEPDGSVVSEWTVRFRNGLLQWTERDVVDHAARRIEFTQLRGDFHEFSGQWQVAPAEGGGSLLTFAATFDLGMPSLEAILDPVAESTLRSNILLIAEGLLGSVAERQPVTVDGRP